MTAIIPRNHVGGNTNSNTLRNTVKGSNNVADMTAMVEIRRCFPGLLLKNGCLVRTTKTIRHAETTDSKNHVVLNSSTVAPIANSVPKVRKSKKELKIPNIIMNFLINFMFQR